MKPRSSVWSCCVAMALMAMVVSCGGGGGGSAAPTTPPPAAPTITSFGANPDSITAGSSTTLTGVFANGTGMIMPDFAPATSGTGVNVSPSSTTTYVLVVTNSAGTSVTQNATVTVTPPSLPQPTITSFTANLTSITAGGTATLTGVFANGAGVITPGDITATSGTGMIVTPSTTTTYTLTVTNALGVAVTQTATVTVLPVVPPPSITSFTANPASIVSGSSTALTGIFANGTGIITPGNLSVTSGTPVNVTPATTTTYTLTVTPTTGQAITKTVTVTVNPWLPVANAGPAQSVGRESMVTLDGSGSTGRNGDTLSYAWTLSTKPAGSTANLFGPSTSDPFFVADVPGTYLATLIVTDGGGSSNPSTVLIVCVSNLSQLFSGMEVSSSKTTTNGEFQATYGLNLVNNSSNGTFNIYELQVTQVVNSVYSNIIYTATDPNNLNGGQIAPGQSPAFLAVTSELLTGTLTATFSLYDPITNVYFSVVYTFPA